MIKYFIFCFLMINLILIQSAYCLNFDIRFDKKSEKLDKVSTLLLGIIPGKIMSRINKPILIKFAPLTEKKLMVDCNETNPEHLPIRGISNNVNSPVFQITLHSGFLSHFEEFKSDSVDYPCGHKNLFRLGLGTILHEIIKLYDSMPLITVDDRKQIEACKNRIEKQDECLQEIGLEKEISSRIQFKQIVWMDSFQSKNQMTQRLAEIRELSNSVEAMAVNFEFYLLDPEFICRRPSLTRYFDKRFGVIRNTPPCPNAKVFIDRETAGQDEIPVADLAVEKVYQIDYLLADKGTDFSSGWGHAMLRIVVCAPYRDVISASCLEDTDFHIVVSFRASPDDIIINSIKGLVGDYRSRLYLKPFFMIKGEYTKGELRDLHAYPLKLDRQQIRQLLDRILESYWSYNGLYKFISYNCATETNMLLKSAWPDSDFISEFVSTPTGLRDLLERSNLIEMSPTPARFYNWESQKYSLERGLQLLQKYGINLNYDIKKAVQNGLNFQSVAAQIGSLRIDNVSKNSLLSYLKILSDREIFTIKSRIQEEIKVLITKIKTKSSTLTEEQNSELLEQRDLLNKMIKDSPQEKTIRGSYGVALAADILPEKELSKIDADKLFNVRKLLFPEYSQRLNEIFEFQKTFDELVN